MDLFTTVIKLTATRSFIVTAVAAVVIVAYVDNVAAVASVQMSLLLL